MAWKRAWLFSCAAVLAGSACSSDDHALGGTAGSSGSGGSAAGAAGSAAHGGSQSGSGGSATGGGAGTAGVAGKGVGGKGGSSTGDSGGTAGSSATGGNAGDPTTGGSAGEAGLGGTGEGGDGAGGAATTCASEGGTVVEIPCSPGHQDFANFCNVGLCSSAPETLTDSILECQCPGGCWDGQQCISEQARRCMESGGTVTTNVCCGSVDAFPDTCAVGACSCSPENSHEVPSCRCPEGGCFDGERCR